MNKSTTASVLATTTIGAKNRKRRFGTSLSQIATACLCVPTLEKDFTLWPQRLKLCAADVTLEKKIGVASFTHRWLPLQACRCGIPVERHVARFSAETGWIAKEGYQQGKGYADGSSRISSTWQWRKLGESKTTLDRDIDMEWPLLRR